MEQYAIYLRKSRADLEAEKLGEGETLARHKRILTELAAKKGFKIVRVYQEIISGESIAARPQMQELLNDVYSKKYTGVLVMEVERLARGNTTDQGTVADAFVYSNTKIITPLKTYDPQNDADMEYFEFGLFMSRREYQTIRRRMRTGLMDYIQAGNYAAPHAPFGYDIVQPNKKERTLAPNENAKYVQMIYDCCANKKMSLGEIARMLNKNHILSPGGNREWDRSAISNILRNPIYIGKMRFQYRKLEKVYENGVMKKTSPRNKDCYIIEGKHPAIIEREVYDRAQEILATRPPITKGTMKNPLAGLIFCSKCGKAMVRKLTTGPKRKYPSERYRHIDSEYCFMKSADCNEVIEIVIQSLEGYVQDFQIKLEQPDTEKELRMWEMVHSKILNELETLKKKQNELYSFLEDGTYTREEFRERKQFYTNKIQETEVEIAQHELIKPAKVDYEQKILKFTEVLEIMRDPEADAKNKNDLLKEIIERIDYNCEDLGRSRGGIITLDIYLK